MSRPVLALPLLLLAGCAEEDEGRGSIEMTGIGVAIPWWVVLGLILATVAVVVLLRRRR